MSVIRLEKFATPMTPNNHPRFVSQIEIEALGVEQYERGVKDGAAAATEAFSSEESRCLGAIEENLGDIAFSTKDAHLKALTSMQPLIVSLVDALVPAIETVGLISQISALIDDVFASSNPGLVEISVSPEMLDALPKAWESITKISSDPNLTNAQAHIHWAAGFNEVDLDRVSFAITSAVSEFFETLNYEQNIKVTHAG